MRDPHAFGADRCDLLGPVVVDVACTWSDFAGLKQWFGNALKQGVAHVSVPGYASSHWSYRSGGMTAGVRSWMCPSAQ